MSFSLQAFADMAIANGPDRVLVDSEGTALSPVRAMEQGVMPHIILIRGDGWTLGAPERLAKAAEALWADEWIGYVNLPSRQAHPLNISGSSPLEAGTLRPPAPSA